MFKTVTEYLDNAEKKVKKEIKERELPRSRYLKKQARRMQNAARCKNRR